MTKRILVVGLLLGSPTARAAKVESAAALLTAADRSRGQVDFGLEYVVDVRCKDSADATLQRTYKVRSFGKNARGEMTAPAANAGDLVLVNGRLIWSLVKDAKFAAPVTLADRLTGLASVGDIASTGLADVYDGKIGKKETFGRDVTQKIELAAKDFKATYRSGRAWIAKDTGLLLKAEFDADGHPGKVATLTYGNTLDAEGQKIKFMSGAQIMDKDRPTSGCDVTFGSPKVTATTASEFDLDAILKARQ